MNNCFINATKFFFLTAGLLFLAGCKKNSGVGITVLPQSDRFQLYQSDSFQLETYTVSEDSLRTDALSVNIIGQLNDPVFGRTTASAIFQTLPREFYTTLGTGLKYDSVVLTLPFLSATGMYGDTTQIQTWWVYELADALDKTKATYNTQMPAVGKVLGKWTGAMFPGTSRNIKFGSKTFNFTPHLRLRLDDVFGQSILNNQAALASIDSWLAANKGLAVVPQSANGTGCLGYFNFALSAGNLSVYYNDSMALNFAIGQNSNTTTARLSHYAHTYAGSQAAGFINKKINANEGYLQALAGTRLWVSLKDWMWPLQQNPDYAVGVQEAELTLKPLAGSWNSVTDLPPRLLLVANDSGKTKLIYDRLDAGGAAGSDMHGRYLGGNFDASRGVYVFRLGRHMQQLFYQYKKYGVNKDMGFYVIVPTDNPATGSRVIFDTNKISGIKFKLTYTLSK